MGSPGCPFPYGENDIRNAIIKTKGVMRQAAKELNCDPATLYRHFNKYPALKPILDEYRWGMKEEDLDSAEEVLRHAMTKCAESDLTNALKASFFFLNNRGKERGYSPIPEQNKEQQKEAYAAVKALAEAMTKPSSQVPSSDTERKEDPS